MARLDEIVNSCGYACANCPYEDCIVDEGIADDEEELTEGQIRYQKSKEKQKVWTKNFYEKHPEKKREYYQKYKQKILANQKHSYSKASRSAKRRWAKTNYDFIQSMDPYDLAEFLARISGKSDKAYLEYLERELKEGNLNE